MQVNSRRKQQGFSLIEVLITLFIIGVVIVLYSSSANTLKLNIIAKHQQIAFGIASSNLESLRGTAYESLPTSGPLTDPMLSSLPEGMGSVTVTSYDSRTKKAEVNVNWVEPGSSFIKSVVLTTLIAQGGIGQ